VINTAQGPARRPAAPRTWVRDLEGVIEGEALAGMGAGEYAPTARLAPGLRLYTMLGRFRTDALLS
jgi:hypothetical protein